MSKACTPVIDRLFAHVGVTESGCWEWEGSMRGREYGQIRVGGHDGLKAYVHRVTYEYFVGLIPEGLQVDHLCRNRRCVNPDHLEAVPRIVNVRRSQNANRAKTTCHRGHLLSGTNLRVTPDGERACRACQRIHDAAHRARRAQLAPEVLIGVKS